MRLAAGKGETTQGRTMLGLRPSPAVLFKTAKDLEGRPVSLRARACSARAVRWKGPQQQNRAVWMMMSLDRVIVTDQRTGKILSESTVQPAQTYWKSLPREDHTLDL